MIQESEEGEIAVAVAKVSDNGRVILPPDVRKKLKVKDGDRVEFAEENGRIYVMNAGMSAYRQLVKDFEGAAEKAGFHNKEELMDYLHDFRQEYRRSWNARNA